MRYQKQSIHRARKSKVIFSSGWSKKDKLLDNCLMDAEFQFGMIKRFYLDGDNGYLTYEYT
jgi:hypothetical protein